MNAAEVEVDDGNEPKKLFMAKKLSATERASCIGGVSLIIAAFVTQGFGLLKSSPPTTAFTGTNIHDNITGSGNTVIDNSIKGDGNIRGNSNTVNVDKSQTVIITTNTVEPFLEGTKFTLSQLNAAFQFGFITITQGPDGEMKQTRHTDDRMEWDIDLESTTFKPDFSAGNFTVELVVKTVNRTKNPALTKVDGVRYVFGSTLEEGLCVPIPQRFNLNDPIPFVGVLSANQRKPVYVVGYRIPPMERVPFRIGQY